MALRFRTHLGSVTGSPCGCSLCDCVCEHTLLGSSVVSGELAVGTNFRVNFCCLFSSCTRVHFLPSGATGWLKETPGEGQVEQVGKLGDLPQEVLAGEAEAYLDEELEEEEEELQGELERENWGGVDLGADTGEEQVERAGAGTLRRISLGTLRWFGLGKSSAVQVKR